MRTPALLGSIIFTISFMVAILTMLLPGVFDSSVSGKQFFVLISVWASGIVAGVGLGYSVQEKAAWAGESNLPTFIGGVGLGGIFVLAFLFFLFNFVPSIAVTIGNIVSGILAFIGIFFVVASSGSSY